MALDQTKASGASTPGTQSASSTPGAKKRPRLTAVTPAGILRQKKRRGGSNAAAATLSARKLAASIRSGASTPTKSRNTLAQASSSSDGGLVTPPIQGEKRGRRPSGMATPANTADSAQPSDAQMPGDLVRSTTAGESSALNEVNNADDDDGDDDIRGPSGDDDMISLVKQSKEEVKELWDQMSEDQRQRYGVYRRTALNKGSVKKLASQILNQQVSPTMAFVIAGFSKMFVGQIVESAVQIQAEWGDEGPLKPAHLREAYRLYKKENDATATSSGFTKRLF
ncbi:transcription initiation factor TFIID subunit 11 [Dipsacomyces acuminosporus]|nr:transcription initiation factor TFIID subunit 11 [Dipsacomyces acuminosporus]